LHVGYEDVESWPLRWIDGEETAPSYRVETMRLKKEKSALVVNESLILADIPAETYGFRLENRSALEWVIDPHRLATDKRSGIISDPNRPDNAEYIVRLIERVVRVSMETVGIIKGMPAGDDPEEAGWDWLPCRSNTTLIPATGPRPAGRRVRPGT
jgi:predicted helicase